MLSLRNSMLVFCCALLPSSAAPAQETARRISALLGGGGREFSNAIAFDHEGNVFIAGWTDSWDFPVPDGWDAPTMSGGTDAFIAKLSPDLTAILSVKTLGGLGDDAAMGIGVTAGGEVIIAGWATQGFPTTPDSFQPENAGGSDIFIASLTPDLELIYSSFLGGGGKEEAWHARVDETGIVTVVGFTQSSDFPCSRNSFQTAFGGGPNDAFVARLRPDASIPAVEQLVYSTFIGGGGDEYLDVHDAWPSADGRIAVFINTSSPDLPTLFRTFRGGFDTYLAVLDPALEGSEQLLYSTYLGGTGNDASGSMRWLDDHMLALVGWTASVDFPQTDGSAYHGGFSDLFLSVLDLEGSDLIYGTLIGGSGADRPKEMMVAPDGSLLIAGATSSGNFPAIHAMSPFVHDNDQPFLLGLEWRRDDPPASRLWFSSSLGGRSGSMGNDYARGIALQPSGLYAVTGLTGASDFPTTPDAVQSSYGGGARDAFVAMLDFRLLQGVSFRRGDANADGAADLSDAITILDNLFLGIENMPCEQAGDTNDDSALDISDAVYLLNFLFLGGKTIEPPFEACGTDPTLDALSCESVPPCVSS